MAKNHYVSQLIIKRFAPSVTTFDMQTNQIIANRQASKIFVERDIYDNDIEKKLAHDLEQPFALILDKKILNCDKIRLTRNELYLVKRFMLMDSVRTYTPEDFQRVITDFSSNTQRYLDVNRDSFNKMLKSLPTTESLHISAYDLHMRAMKLYLECATAEEMLVHPLATQELYCWAKVVFDAYLSFWDSHDNHEFILSSSGMLSDYEPSHIIFEGVDLSKFSYLLEQMRKSGSNQNLLLFYAYCLAFNNLMYENFNIFNLSSTRCMVLVHPFFNLYNNEIGVVNGENVVAPKPDIWPSWIESRDVSQRPIVKYKTPGILEKDDEFEYSTVKLTEWDTIYVNQLILSQTHRLMGFNHIEKIIDSIVCINLHNSLCDKELFDKLQGLDALERWIDNMLRDKYCCIFEHYKDRRFNCTVNPFEYIEHYSEMGLRDTRGNQYLLRYLLFDEEKVKTMSNFAFMGDPEKRIQLMKADLKHIENKR